MISFCISPSLELIHTNIEPCQGLEVADAILAINQAISTDLADLIASYVVPIFTGSTERVNQKRESALVTQAFQVDSSFAEKLKRRKISSKIANLSGYSFLISPNCARASITVLFLSSQVDRGSFSIKIYRDDREEALEKTMSGFQNVVYFNLLNETTLVIIEGRYCENITPPTPGNVHTARLIDDSLIVETRLSFPERTIHMAEISQDKDRLYLAFRKDNHYDFESYRLSDFELMAEFNSDYAERHAFDPNSTYVCESIFANSHYLVLYYQNYYSGEDKSLFVFYTVEHAYRAFDLITPLSIYRCEVRFSACALINNYLVLRSARESESDLINGTAFAFIGSQRRSLHSDIKEALHECDRIKVQRIINRMSTYPHLNSQDALGNTFLHIIAQSQPEERQDRGDHLNLQVELIRALLQAGADPLIRNSTNHTFSELASAPLRLQIGKDIFVMVYTFFQTMSGKSPQFST